jgi:hypothetical protein
MKILKNQFKVLIETWDDPGDYPSGAGGGPLPSYNYIADVEGAMLLLPEPGDNLDPSVIEEFVHEHIDLPNGLTAEKFHIETGGPGGVISVIVAKFNADDWEEDDGWPDDVDD